MTGNFLAAVKLADGNEIAQSGFACADDARRALQLTQKIMTYAQVVGTLLGKELTDIVNDCNEHGEPNRNDKQADSVVNRFFDAFDAQFAVGQLEPQELDNEQL